MGSADINNENIDNENFAKYIKFSNENIDKEDNVFVISTEQPESELEQALKKLKNVN